MAEHLDRVGMRYGRLTVVSFNRKEKKTGGGYVYYWNCKCDCGNETIVGGGNLASGQCKSCGCLRRELMSVMRKGVHVKYGVIPNLSTEKEALAYLYDITPDGRIFSRCDGKERVVCNGPKGYKYIRLINPQFSKNKDGRKTYKVHRLVAMFHLPDYSEYLQVNHKNGDKTDNRVENLEMVTNRQNVNHAWHILDSSKRRERLSASLRAYNSCHTRIFRRKWIRHCLKPVGRYVNGILDKRYECMTDAAKDVGVSISTISRCVIHGGMRKGFTWRRI